MPLPTWSELCEDGGSKTNLVRLHTATRGSPAWPPSPLHILASASPPGEPHSCGHSTSRCLPRLLASLQAAPGSLSKHHHSHHGGPSCSDVRIIFFQLILCFPALRRGKAPYLSRQVMGSAATPRHMLRAGHRGIQQLIGSLGQHLHHRRCCRVLEKRRGAAFIWGGRAGRVPSTTPGFSQPRAAPAASAEDNSLGRCSGRGGREARP